MRHYLGEARVKLNLSVRGDRALISRARLALAGPSRWPSSMRWMVGGLAARLSRGLQETVLLVGMKIAGKASVPGCM